MPQKVCNVMLCFQALAALFKCLFGMQWTCGSEIFVVSQDRTPLWRELWRIPITDKHLWSFHSFVSGIS